jgi:hypothetical protein
MNTFAQSGNLGDLIYSLAVAKKLGGGEFFVKLRNIPNVIRHYNNGPVPPEYEDRLSDNDYKWLYPLLEAQEYITKVEEYTDQHVSVNLDDFRGVIHRTVQGNFLKAFYTTHNIPFTDEDLIQPWLTVPEPEPVAKFVVARSPRWRSSLPSTNDTWKQLIANNNITQEGVFVGLPEEHVDFETTLDIKIAYHPVKDFLELAQVIDGAEVFLGNQTFTYGIAQGLGKSTVLETFSARPLPVNECFFARSNCYYF